MLLPLKKTCWKSWTWKTNLEFYEVGMLHRSPILNKLNCIFLKVLSLYLDVGFPGSSVVKNLSANTGILGYVGLIPGLGRYPGGENGNPLQYSCLENRMDRGAWSATVHRVAKSRTQLSTHAYTHTYLDVWNFSILKFICLYILLFFSRVFSEILLHGTYLRFHTIHIYSCLGAKRQLNSEIKTQCFIY